MDMNNIWYLRIINILIFAFYFFSLGAWGLLTQRPLLIPTRWYLVLMLLIFIPGMLTPFLLPAGTANLGWFVAPVFLLILFVGYGRLWNGFSIMGINDPSFRDALLAALDKMGVKYKEDMTGIHIPSRSVDLRTAHYFGQSSVRFKGEGARELSAELGPVLREQLRKKDLGFDPKPFFFYLALGVVFLLLSYQIYNLHQSIEQLMHR